MNPKIIKWDDPKDIEWKLVGWLSEGNKITLQYKDKYNPSVTCAIDRLKLLKIVLIEGPEKVIIKKNNEEFSCNQLLIRKIAAIEE